MSIISRLTRRESSNLRRTSHLGLSRFLSPYKRVISITYLRIEKMTFVTLKIYNFKLLGFVKEFHCEVTAYGLSWSYSEDGLETSDILNKHGQDGYELVESYSLGFSAMSRHVFGMEYLPSIQESFTIDGYNLFTNNCRHFSLKMIKVLCPSRREKGLYILSKLNEMSENVGQFFGIIVRNLFNIFADPKRLISSFFFLIMCFNRGKLFDCNIYHKDVLTIFLLVIIIVFVLCRNRL